MSRYDHDRWTNHYCDRPKRYPSTFNNAKPNPSYDICIVCGEEAEFEIEDENYCSFHADLLNLEGE